MELVLPTQLQVAYLPETAFKNFSHTKLIPGANDDRLWSSFWKSGSTAAIYLAGVEMYNCLIAGLTAAQHNQTHDVPMLVGGTLTHLNVSQILQLCFTLAELTVPAFGARHASPHQL